MRYRQLGSTGLEVSAVGLGTNNFGTRLDEAASHAVLDAAVEAGVTLIDTADVYAFGESERIIGSWLPAHRDDVVIATKVGLSFETGMPNEAGTSAHRIANGVDEALSRLRTDHIDLLQLHIFDPKTPLDETLRAVDDVVTAGKVRYVGCSNFMSWEVASAIERARSHGWAQLVTVQPEWSMLHREVEAELVPLAQSYGVGILPYRPLARGLLTGKYQRGASIPGGTRLDAQPQVAEQLLTDASFDVVEGAQRLAELHDQPMAALAIAWLLGHPIVSSVLAGASTPEQVRANAAAADWVVDADTMAALEDLLPPGPQIDIGRLAWRRA